MGLATVAAQLLREAGITPEQILGEAGVDREGAVRELADKLNVNLAELVELPGQAVPIEQADVDKVREGLAVLNRAFQ